MVQGNDSGSDSDDSSSSSSDDDDDDDNDGEKKDGENADDVTAKKMKKDKSLSREASKEKSAEVRLIIIM